MEVSTILTAIFIGCLFPLIIYAIWNYIEWAKNQRNIKRIYAIDINRPKQGLIPFGAYIETKKITIENKNNNVKEVVTGILFTNGLNSNSLNCIISPSDDISQLCVVKDWPSIALLYIDISTNPDDPDDSNEFKENTDVFCSELFSQKYMFKNKQISHFYHIKPTFTT